MNPVLLYTDAKSIVDTQTIIANAVPVYQGIYNAMIAVGVTAPTLAEIKNLIVAAAAQKVSNEDAIFGISGLSNLAPDFVTNYVKNKLVYQATPYVVNGISWPGNKIAEIITVPDLTGVLTSLQPVWGGNSQKVFIKKHLEYFSYLTLAANVVGIVANSVATITTAFTYYTQNDSSAALANAIQAVCDALNSYNAGYAVNLNKSLPPTDSVGDEGAPTAIAGVAIRIGQYVINRKFVQSFERNNNAVVYEML